MSEANAVVILVDNATGEPPSLSRPGDQIVCLGVPKLVGTQYRQLVEVRPAVPVEQAEAAAYDAIEVLRGRIGCGLDLDGEGRRISSYRLRAQRLRSAAKLVQSAVDDLARAVEVAK